MTYRFFLIVCLQVFYQNVHSQAINPAIEPTEVTITKTIIENPLDNQPSSTEVPTTVNQEYGPCGLPIHLCQCNSQPEVTVGYSAVVLQSDAAQSICPRCGLSVELCKCGNLAEVTDEVNPAKLCPNCGRSVELCICSAPTVVAPETTEDNQSKPQSIAPLEVVPESAIVNQPNNPSLCPNCGHPIELCICGNPTAVTETSPMIEVISPVFEGTSFVVEGTSPVVEGTSPLVEGTSTVVEGTSPVVEGTSPVVEGTSPVVEVISAEGNSRVVVCPKCGRSVELCVCSKETSTPQMCPHCDHPIELCMCGAHHHH